MTDLSDESLDELETELEFAENTGQEPGFIRRGVGIGDDKWDEYVDNEGQLHRLTGPAIKNVKGTKQPDTWYYHGKKLNCKSQEEFEKIQRRLLKIKVFW